MNGAGLIDFGKWRAILNHPASPSTWADLCDALGEEQWTEHKVDVLLPYLEGRLRHWDDALRTLPRQWISDVLEGQQVPCASLVRTLMYEASRAYTSAWSTLCTCGILRGFTRFDLGSCAIDSDDIEVLMTSGLTRSLVYLNLWNNALDDMAIRSLCQPDAWPKLKWLNLGYNRAISTTSLDHLCEMPWLAQLEYLQLRGTWISLKAARAFAESDQGRSITNLEYPEY